jgi:hypothetical protein
MSRCLLLCLILIMNLFASNALAIEVSDILVTTAVIDREPVDNVEVFPRQSGKVFCFTRITGADEPTVVHHVWYRGEQLMSRTVLPVNSPDWRTWSARQLLEDLPGAWRVEIQDVDGNVLQEVNFQLR